MIELLLSLSVLAGPTSGGVSPASSVSDGQQDTQVNRSARQYRIEVYRTFREDRAEFDRRRTTGSEVLKAWFAAGRDPEDGEAAVRWFEDAVKRMRSDFGQPLPPTLVGTSSQPPVLPQHLLSPTADDENGRPSFHPPATNTFDRFDAPNDYDDPSSAAARGATSGVFTTSADPGSASPSSSPLESLRRALIKAAVGASRQTESEPDGLPDWPSRDTQ